MSLYVVALQQLLKFDQYNFRISELYQLEVSLFDQLMGDHILSLDLWYAQDILYGWLLHEMDQTGQGITSTFFYF